ncbi:leucine-rich repeat receptor-like protein kinase TDR isoform X2 [Hibiscus syriacus]|uniref:leucine-rich repeat receptor-like protein kinase TDR isoform X2 n=1 Tax=Hibiscus syriacus TaxID=106335 RepID=UPI001921A03A|nr:leucine-rich repeat receptor-like protein kinase TDR isoform X2 [Hibiscus syriacus]
MEIFLWPHLKLLLSSILIAVVLAADPYSDALLSFKSEIIDHFHSLDDWLMRHGENRSGKVHACSWSGIKCDNNSAVVIGLDLSTKKLGGKLPGKQFSVFTELVELNISQNAFSGEIPIEIFNLTSLRSLDISRNNFSGHFPGGINVLRNLVVLDAFSNSFSGPLPVELSELEFLKVLNLAGSYFNGPIPSAYGSFKSLEFLHLAGNFLSGNIPPELGNLQTVEHMEIGYNSYEGNIPWQLGNMSELQYLDIASANLSGSIPKQLSNLTKLQSLFLFRNQLTGLIPWEFSRILPLTNLDLSDNLISGPIHESFAELKNLRLLSLMYNVMNGSVPDGIAELPSLDTLFIWNNFFTGSLPRNLGKNSKLRWLDVSTNSFIGSIPPHICAGGELFKLILFSNKFTGNLSPLSNCSSLVRIRLEDNSFSGEIPLTLSHLPDVTYIDFSRNRFTGGIPSDFFQASRLQYFNVSNNPELGGMVPEETWSLPLLQNFSASSCNISGNLPPFRSCKSMLLVELQMNNMSGVVPKSISNCKTLEIINLASNQLIGHIPEELASLPALSVVDLSHNNFSGSIPVEFGKSTNLLLLNVSFNDISGSIPSEKVLQSMDRSAYVGNPELCGAPLRSCSASMAIFGSKGTGKLRLVLLLSAGIAILISALVFWLVYLRKGSKGQWKMDSFIGLPQFKANDVLRSFDSSESMDELPPLSAAVCKAVLPTGITVLVKKIEWEPKRIKAASEFITQMGNARHRNLIRLLGFCYNKHMAYMLYDYLPNGNLAEKVRIPRDWSTKCRIIIGIAKGLCFLHHDCNPAISHGDLKSSNIVFDDNFEPRIADFGFKYLIELTKGQSNEDIKDELYMDIYKFGEIIMEILTNGRLINGGENIQSKPKDVLLREICNENESTDSTNSLQDEIKLFVEVALLCTRSRPADRPSMEDVSKPLSGLKGQGK